MLFSQQYDTKTDKILTGKKMGKLVEKLNENFGTDNSGSILWNSDSTILPGDPKKYSCLIKRKTHNKREILKIKIVLNYQCANLSFDILVLIFGCHLAEI